MTRRGQGLTCELVSPRPYVIARALHCTRARAQTAMHVWSCVRTSKMLGMTFPLSCVRACMAQTHHFGACTILRNDIPHYNRLISAHNLGQRGARARHAQLTSEQITSQHSLRAHVVMQSLKGKPVCGCQPALQRQARSHRSCAAAAADVSAAASSPESSSPSNAYIAVCGHAELPPSVTLQVNSFLVHPCS